MNTGPFPKSKRDRRMDVLRGLALLMIFVDHIPRNVLAWLTLHNFGFSDAAEVFVLLAGLASTMAYGKVFDRDGVAACVRRVGLRCVRIYFYQAGLLIFTLALVAGWTRHFQQEPTLVEPLLAAGLDGLLRGLLLQALPGYLDILPLYIVLLGLFPLLYAVLRRWRLAALAASAAVWLLANLDSAVNLPNWLDDNGWYFNPFAWQFLFTIGAVLAVTLARYGGMLPRNGWLTAAVLAYLGFAFLQSAPWAEWHLPALRLFPMATPQKSNLSPLRIVDMLALTYVVFSSPRIGRVLTHRLMRPIELCGKHSLEVFAGGCALALVGRLIFRTFGADWPLQVAVNAVGLVTLCVLAAWLEQRKQASRAARSVPAPAA